MRIHRGWLAWMTAMAMSLPGVAGAETTPRPTVVVQDIEDLSAAVQSDPEAAEPVAALARRRRTARWVGWGGFLLGAGLTTAGVLALRGRCPEGDCGVRPTPLPLALIGSGLAVGAGGLFASYKLAPSRDALELALEPWNRRHPDQPLMLLRNRCFDPGDQACTDGPPMALPAALLISGRVLTVRGRAPAAGDVLVFGPFRTQQLDRGTRLMTTRRRGDQYTRELEHRTSFRLQGMAASPWSGRCEERVQERGAWQRGLRIEGQLGPVGVSGGRPEQHRPGAQQRSSDCHLSGPSARVARLVFAETGVAFEGPAGFALAIENWERRIQYRAGEHVTLGYRLKAGDRDLAVIDVNAGGRVAMDSTLSPEQRDLLAAVAVALFLRADSASAPTRVRDLTLP